MIRSILAGRARGPAFVPALLVAALASPLCAGEVVVDGHNHRQPSSVLVFPVHRSGGTFFTVISVTNTDTMPATPFSFGGSTLAHYEYVNAVPNPADPFSPLNCVIFDRVEFLTPADTLSVLTSCHNATAAAGQEGYLVVSAQDPAAFDQPWSHNRLIGSALVFNASRGMYSVNAFGCRSPLPHHYLTDFHPADGRLDLDGNEYCEAPDQLYIDSFIGVGRSQLALLNLTGGPHATNTVAFSIWNDNEFPLSTTRTFKCWFDRPLNQVSPLFEADFLAGVPNDPGELDVDCDGVDDLETGWAIIDSIDVQSSGGNFISSDGALLGSISSGPIDFIDGGHLLWESRDTQDNGVFFTP